MKPVKTEYVSFGFRLFLRGITMLNGTSSQKLRIHRKLLFIHSSYLELVCSCICASTKYCEDLLRWMYQSFVFPSSFQLYLLSCYEFYYFIIIIFFFGSFFGFPSFFVSVTPYDVRQQNQKVINRKILKCFWCCLCGSKVFSSFFFLVCTANGEVCRMPIEITTQIKFNE